MALISGPLGIHISGNIYAQADPFEKHLIFMNNDVLGYTYTLDDARTIIDDLAKAESKKLTVANKTNAKVEFSTDRLSAKVFKQYIGYVYNGSFILEHTFSITTVPKLEFYTTE